MCKRSQRNFEVALSKINPEVLNSKWTELTPGAMRFVTEFTGEKMMTLIAEGKATYTIYFDGTRMPQNYHLKVPVRYWYFTRKGHLKGIYLSRRWPVKEKYLPPSLPQTSSLNDALKLYPKIVAKLPASSTPTNHKDLEKILRASKIENVLVKFIVSWKPFTEILWFNFVKDHDDLVVVYAYRNAVLEIQYAMLDGQYGKCPRLLTRKRGGGPQNPILKTYTDHYLTSQNNRRSSMSLIENGLNLALRLAVINREEFLQQCHLQSCFNGFLFCKFNNCFTVECVSYVDFEQSQFFLVNSDQDWKEMFAYLLGRVERLVQLKRETLGPIMQRLREDGQRAIYSKHKQCYEELEHFSKRAKIFTYDSDDRLLHLLKLPLANFFVERDGKKFTSVSMKVTRDNSLVQLVYKNMSIVNFGSILAFEHHTNTDGDLSGLRLGMSQWDPFYSSEAESLQSQDCDRDEKPVDYCIEFARTLFNCYQNFSAHLSQNFWLDINTVKFLSLPTLSNLVFWHAYLKFSPNGFLVHPVEKSLPSNDAKLREFCHGGYTFSGQMEMRAGEPMDNKKGEIAKSIYSLDLTASYGFAASHASVPGGFGSTWKFGQRQESSQRYRFFEFRAVFYTIYKWQNQSDRKLIATYHNYSPLGIYWVGKYPIDLVGIFEDGSMDIYQMDGAFCHGCKNPNCPNLPSYVDGRSRQECQDKTDERNREIWDWIDDRHDKIKFYTVTDCCNPEYSNGALKFYFETIPELSSLISGYNKIDGRLDNLDKQLTFVAIADISCFPLEDRDRDFDGPLFLDSKKMAWSGKVLLTRDYYKYLKTNFRVDLKHVELAIFYKVDRVFSRVYSYFLQQRNCQSEAVKKFYKSIVNMSCGFFGANPASKNVKFVRLTDKVPKNFSFENYKIITIPDSEAEGEFFYPPDMTYHKNKHVLFVVQTYVSKAARENPKPSLQSLPLFATVVEFGKLRLNQIFYFYSRHIPKDRFKVVYAHIDSTVVVVSRDTLEEAARDPKLFNAEWHKKYFSKDKKIPGLLHAEFHHDSSTHWKFVTPAICTWALVKDGDDGQVYKMPGVAQKSNALMFEKQMEYLRQGTMTIPIQRRIKKLAGTQTTSLDLCYVSKK